MHNEGLKTVCALRAAGRGAGDPQPCRPVWAVQQCRVVAGGAAQAGRGELGGWVARMCVCVPACLRQQSGIFCLLLAGLVWASACSSARRLTCMVLPRMHPAAGIMHAGCRCGAAVQVEALLRKQADASQQQQAEDRDGEARWWAPFVSTLQAYCLGAGLVLLRVGVCGHCRGSCWLGAVRGVVCSGGGLHSEPRTDPSAPQTDAASLHRSPEHGTHSPACPPCLQLWTREAAKACAASCRSRGAMPARQW